MIAVVVFGFSLIDTGDGDVTASAILIPSNTDISGYARAIDPWEWEFPRDHGPHSEFQTEWWYYTGNLATDDGRRFGYQFTIFRRAITPQTVASQSEWRDNQIYMAHFTLSDIQGEQFYHDQRFSRGGAQLAGAMVEPRFRVWLEDWQIEAQNPDATQLTIQAAGDDFAIDLTLEQSKPPALQGQNGLSPKSEVEGNASYYYSLSRLLTGGTVTVNGLTSSISGTTWMDHEFSTSALGEDAQGWDWFGLIFDDGSELMVGQIRLADGGREPAFGGLFIYTDGNTQYLTSAEFTIEATDTWESPHSGAVYPAGWVIAVSNVETRPALSEQTDDMRITLTPLLADQELHGGGIIYWEGAVRIEGDKTGYGYAELTGYVDTMSGRF